MNNSKNSTENSICDINLIVDDVESGITANSFSFTLYDSIYELLPKGKLILNDTLGQFNEFLGFVDGTKIELKYGRDKDNLVSCIYRICNNSTPQQTTIDSIGGNLELSLIHDYFNVQNKTSKCYKENISDIVKKISKTYNFKKTNIDSTLNNGVWYQPYITDVDFISNYLLPFSYSTDSNKTPFYCFITSDNVFNFKNFNNMINNSPKETYYLKPTDGLSDFDKIIYQIKYAQSSMSDLKPLYNRMRYYYDKNGNYHKEEINSLFSDYPSNTKNQIPIKANLNYITGVEKQYYDDIKSEENTNNRMGLETNAFKSCIGLDKVILTVNINTDIHAGDVIKINIPSCTSENSSEVSLRTSGNYLVESTYQKWNGNSFYTILVCCKNEVKLTSDYRNSKLILSR